MILDHVGFGVSDYDRACAFYDRALAPLAIARVMEMAADRNGGVRATGYGRGRKPEFWIGDDGRTAPALHVAFLAPDRAAVDAFHEAALAAGGTDNGRPGLRPHYHPAYYAAFVRDPDGHNVEAVCHAPE